MMAFRFLLPALLAALAVSIFVACGGGGETEAPAATGTIEDANGAPSGTAAPNGSPSGTEAPAGEQTPGANGAAATADGATPTAFEALRDAFIDDLAGIGVNIGAVPEDVREALLATCEELSAFADVEAVCGAVARAMDSGDSGLIDLVLDELAELAAE